MKRDLLTILDLTAAEILALFTRAREMKAAWHQGTLRPVLQGKTLGLLFTKPFRLSLLAKVFVIMRT